MAVDQIVNGILLCREPLLLMEPYGVRPILTARWARPVYAAHKSFADENTSAIVAFVLGTH